MDGKLLKEAIIKFVSGVILIGVLLFLPAWDIRWRNGWMLMAILFIPMFFAGIIMYKKAPDLLRSRLKARETQSEQKDVISRSGIMFLAASCWRALTTTSAGRRFPHGSYGQVSSSSFWHTACSGRCSARTVTFPGP